MSQCLIITTCGCAGIDKLEFCEPFFNGIRIISADSLLWDSRPPYYGDLVNIDFYRWLGLDIGEDSQPTWTRTDGYRYVYNMTRRSFSVFDPSSTIIHTKQNITSMGDMGITFDIYKSHQFIIVADDIEDAFPFLLPVDLIWEIWPAGVVEDMDRGILNYYPVDDTRPYSSDNANNPYVDMHYIEGYIFTKLLNWHWMKRLSLDDVPIDDYKVLTKPDINFKGRGHDPLKICDDFEILERSITRHYKGNKLPPKPFDPEDPETWPPGFDPEDPETWPPGFDPEDEPGYKIDEWRGTLLDISYLLPSYTISLYPELMPIKRSDETINNRAVYEPWMIWGIRFMAHHFNPLEPDDHEVFAFDLSPNYGF